MEAAAAAAAIALPSAASARARSRRTRRSSFPLGFYITPTASAYRRLQASTAEGTHLRDRVHELNPAGEMLVLGLRARDVRGELCAHARRVDAGRVTRDALGGVRREDDVCSWKLAREGVVHAANKAVSSA